MPFQCSSQRLTNFAAGLCLSPSSFLPPSRIALSVRLPVRRPSMRVTPPTFSEIDIWLSLRITSRLGSTEPGSAPMPPAWASASNAMPAVIAPSPITATTLRSSPARCSAIAMPSAAEMLVELWPTPKVSYSDSSRFGNGATPSGLLDGVDVVAAAGEDLVRVALVADVPDQAVDRRLVQPVQGDGELDHAQARRRNGRRTARPVRSGTRATRRRSPAVPLRGTGAGRRGPRCGRGAGSAADRSLLGL